MLCLLRSFHLYSGHPALHPPGRSHVIRTFKNALTTMDGRDAENAGEVFCQAFLSHGSPIQVGHYQAHIIKKAQSLD